MSGTPNPGSISTKPDSETREGDAWRGIQHAGASHRHRMATRGVPTHEQEEDARRVLDVLPKRFGRYGLRLHPARATSREVQQTRGTSMERGSVFLTG
jgi:hypothetical protein